MVKRLNVKSEFSLKLQDLKTLSEMSYWDRISETGTGICRGFSQVEKWAEVNMISFLKDRHSFLLMKGYAVAHMGNT